ncbi:sugar ABC transporter substrate-binding protein [Aureimonas altamirensis]|uniref:ABC transporter substrate-binding protein n=1 Tax=Aureimonas altamirensis TaxID=370622 RepID=UPI001E3CDB17|nr:sugar ABC transporter substrate-binding protein [Aureimonas altamirensis]UHD47711.1 sugar ABC transporter substrate-binding protein [Aureimonas altamirensis]
MLSTHFAGNAHAQPIDVAQWSPEYIRSIAGTETFDAASECATLVPSDYRGRLTYWYVGPNDSAPQIHRDMDNQFWEAWTAAYPNIQTEIQSVGYAALLDKMRTATLGNAGPMVVKMPILGGIEFAAKGYFAPIQPKDIGYSDADFWPEAIKSVTWEGETYGIPTANETMGLVWNADLFKRAGLDPEVPPQTWDDLVRYSAQIHEKLGVPGYGLVAKPNVGNTPYRFMPQIWAYGGGALDETEAEPTYDTVMLNNEGTKAALQAAYDMYVRDKSVPVSALSNTQAENQNPFISGRLGMMIAHPEEYAKMRDLAAKATGGDREVADAVIENIRYGLLPEGPARRAVVFGGYNIHVLADEYVDGGLDEDAAKAFVCFNASPEWSTKLAWVSSNPGNLRGFRSEWMAERLKTIPFLDITTSMLPSGIPFPVIPESTEIMNSIVPDMLQNTLTGRLTIDEAAENAAREVEALIGGGL